eukprot:12976590-Alexandrium_andersonii.AAC.1
MRTRSRFNCGEPLRFTWITLSHLERPLVRTPSGQSTWCDSIVVARRSARGRSDPTQFQRSLS